MKFVSIDLETTSNEWNSDTCQVIEFGAVADSYPDCPPLAKLPTFHRYVAHQVYTGNAGALAMNARVFQAIDTGGPEVIPVKSLAFEFHRWLRQIGYAPDGNGRIAINVAGKNFGACDLQVLNRVPSWNHFIGVHRRITDPATLYLDPFTMSEPPCLPECMALAGLKPTGEHTAVGDALDVVRLLRHHYLHNAEERAA